MFLTSQDMEELTGFRHELHRNPEVSGNEARTADRVVEFLAPLEPDGILTGLGGHGVAIVFNGQQPGPTILFRAELDALPIEELGDPAWRSQVSGTGHLCGHDGHMTILAALARGLSRNRPERGRIVLMFQPAEETGAGAAAVIDDPLFAEIVPDLSFSLHNMPGLPVGHAAIREGVVNCASRGMRITLVGKTAHASMPETGISPALAVAHLIPALGTLVSGDVHDADFAMTTITHVRIGEAAFGIAPGLAEIWVTLRTLTDATMARLCQQAEEMVRQTATAHGLATTIAYDDIFLHCENAPEAVAHLVQAFTQEGITFDERSLPMRGSEDFGRFGSVAPAAMFFPGSGEKHPSLHNPDYDFPDELIGIGARVFMRVARNILG